MRQRKASEREANQCPECASAVDSIGSTLFLCADADAALRIVEFVKRPVFVRIGSMSPRLLYPDGSWQSRTDIIAGHSGTYWYTGNGLRLEEATISWLAGRRS